MPNGAPVKVPGYINAWAKQYLWQERAAAWDAHIESLAEVADVAQLQIARRQIVEQAADLQDAIESELEEVKRQMERERRLGGHIDDRSAQLANLAAALKDTAAARLMALGGGESE